MPLYEYQCDACGRFETLQKFSDKPLKRCPTCSKPVNRLISAPAFQFKGSGWYVTDYARSGSSDAKSDKKSETKSSESGTSSESSPPSSDSTSKTNLPPKESAATSKGEAKSAKASAPAPAAPSGQ